MPVLGEGVTPIETLPLFSQSPAKEPTPFSDTIQILFEYLESNIHRKVTTLDIILNTPCAAARDACLRLRKHKGLKERGYYLPEGHREPNSESGASIYTYKLERIEP